MCWNECKINFQNFPIFIFSVMIDCIYNSRVTNLDFKGHYVPKKIVQIDYSFVSAHCTSFMKIRPYLRGGGEGVCISILRTGLKTENSKKRTFFHRFQNFAHIFGPKTKFCHFWMGMSLSRNDTPVISNQSIRCLGEDPTVGDVRAEPP